MTLTADVREYALTSYTGLRSVTSVEYPGGQSPQGFLIPRNREDPDGFWGRRYFDVRGGDPPTVLILGPMPGASQTAVVTYRADHAYPTLDATTWTVPDHDVDLLLLYGVWLALASLARESRGGPEVTVSMVAGARNDYDRALSERMNYGSMAGV